MPQKTIPIAFTFDVICPFTYLAKKRLDKALSNTTLPEDVAYTLIFKSYQLYPETSTDGVDKWEWYKEKKYNGSEEKMEKYALLMQEQGTLEGITFSWKGIMANTFNAHRFIQHYQDVSGPEVANKLLMALYHLYFECEKHPSSVETLVEAAKMAGIGTDKKIVKEFVDGREGVTDTKMMIGEQQGNWADGVPVVVFEGRRRDLTLVGTTEKGVEDYEKAIKQIVKEL